MSGEGESRVELGGGTGPRRRAATARLLALGLLLASGAAPRVHAEPEPPPAPDQPLSVPLIAVPPPSAPPQAQPSTGMTGPDLLRLYEGQAWRTLWTEDTRRQLRVVLDGAIRHGLDRSPVVAAPKDLDTASDATLSRIALRYAQALAMGAADPDRLHAVFELRRNIVDLPTGLSAALASGQLTAWFDSLAPSDAEYQALSAAYVQARAHDFPPAAHPIAAGGPAIAPGASDPRVPAISRRLVALGYLKPAPRKGRRATKGANAATAAAPGKLVYFAAMASAVKRAQADAGLAATGTMTADTIQVLNGGPGPRARTLAVNLERLRWLARDPPANRMDVNIAAAELRIYDGGTVVSRRKVIVGAPSHETPLIEASFSRIVVNPPWYVPQSIARREILPKGRGYMARHGMVVRGGRVIQRPGPASALGQVKFDLQDDHQIYLHDTPSKELFDRAGRHLSHGCVRVADAVELAETLAGSAGRLSDLEDALASNATHTVPLGADIPVRLLYLTAFVDDGVLRYAPDAYGWDEEVAEALGLGAAASRKSAEAGADLGP